MLASAAQFLSDMPATKAAAASKDTGSVVSLKLSSEQPVKCGAQPVQPSETGDDAREATGGAEMRELTPRSAKTSASQVDLVVRGLSAPHLPTAQPWRCLHVLLLQFCVAQCVAACSI